MRRNNVTGAFVFSVQISSTYFKPRLRIGVYSVLNTCTLCVHKIDFKKSEKGVIACMHLATYFQTATSYACTNFSIWGFHFNLIIEYKTFRLAEQSTDKRICILTTLIVLRVTAMQAYTCHSKIYLLSYVVNFRKYFNEKECIRVKEWILSLKK